MDPRTRASISVALIALSSCFATACTVGAPSQPAASPLASTATPAPSTSSPQESSADGQRNIGRFLIGMGAAEFVVSTVFALMARYENGEATESCPELNDDCTQARARRADARSSSIVSIVAAGVGVLSLVGGFVLVGTAPADTRSAAPTAGAAPTGMSVRTSW